MQVGDYVRFKDKRGNTYIRKIVEIPEDNRYASIYIDKDANYSNGLSPKNIIKSSSNIIDLIEVGDYVNGIKIDEIIKKSDKEICYRYIYANEEFDVYTFKKEDIKSIIAKEQFENMEYKIYE